MLEVVHLSKTYSAGQRATLAVADLHFTVRANEFVSIVGLSGCGKPTLLRMIAGLLPGGPCSSIRCTVWRAWIRC